MWYLYSINAGGSTTQSQSGTRHEMKKAKRARGNNSFYVVSSMEADKFQRIHGYKEV